MPIYEYRCPNGHLFELFQRMSDPPAEVCEECGAFPVTKVLHPVPVFFKGSGFYSTDYGRSKRRSESDETSDSGSKSDDSGSGSEKKTESKSDEKKAAAAE